MSINDALLSDYVSNFPSEVARRLEVETAHLQDIQKLPAELNSILLERIDPSHLPAIFLSLTQETQIDILETSSVRLALTILRSLDEDDRVNQLSRLDDLPREELGKLLAFSTETSGYYMDRPQSRFETTDTVSNALEKLHKVSQHRTRSIYVVDENNTLTGRVDMQDMAIAKSDALLNTLINPVEGSVNLTSPRKDLLDIFDKYRVDSIPVLDLEDRLLGVIRYASLFQAVEDQASANIQKMVGGSAEERALSTSMFAVKKRLPWLHINLLTAFLAASVVGLFESTIAQFTALAILLPVVAGQSGNAGSQALAVTMRGLALKEISILQWRAVLSKELKIGIVDGVALAITCGLGVFIWSSSLGLAIVIGIAMITSMIAAGISGALVPMMLIRVGQDPATASSIILTTVTDIAGFMSFLGTATLLASML